MRFSARVLILVLIGLAGCIGDSGGSAKLSYNGNGNGVDEDSTDCDNDGTVYARGQVDDGQVTLRVTDDAGRAIYTKTFDGGINIDSDAIQGTGGDWTLRATRSSDSVLSAQFSGDYSFRLAC